MTDHDCFTDQQGRLPCSCTPRRTCAELGVCQGRTPPCKPDCLPVLHQHNSDGSDAHESNHPWDWIDELSYPMYRALLIAVAAAIVGVAYRLFH